MANFFYNLGKLVGQTGRRANWLLQSLTGTDTVAVEAEYAVGADLAKKYADEHELDADTEVRRFVTDVATRLVECVADPNRRFTFNVVKTKECNAFAYPGGFIFVTRPLLELCEWRADEAAFVLAHEMGHVLSRHAVYRMLASSAVRTALARIPIGGLLGMGVFQTVSTLLDQGYSREQEFEADSMGVRLVHYAGFDPQAGKQVLRRLATVPPGGWFGSKYFASHPPVSERIANIDRQLRELAEQKPREAGG